MSIVHAWESDTLRLNLLKDTIMLLFWSTISQSIDGFMEWKPRMKWSTLLLLVKQWYSDIADLAKHKLVVFVRDNAGENKSRNIKDFFESKGVRNHFSSAHEQWQNGPAEASINLIMRLARTVMAEFGLGGEVLVQSGCGREGCAQCNIHWADQDFSTQCYVKGTKGCISI